MESEGHLSSSRSSSIFTCSNSSVSAGLTTQQQQQPRRRIIQTPASETSYKLTESGYRMNDSPIPSHAIPIFLGILPYLLTLLFGNADFWTEISFLFTSIFWLWLSLKLPWDFYYYIKKSEKHKNREFIEFLASLLLFITPFLTIYCLDIVQKYFYHGSGSVMFSNHIFLIVALLNPIKFFFTGQGKTRKSPPPRQQQQLDSDLEEVIPAWASQLQYKLDQLESRINQELSRPQKEVNKPLQVGSIPMCSIDTMENSAHLNSEYYLFQKEIMQRFRVLEASILPNHVNKHLDKPQHHNDRLGSYTYPVPTSSYSPASASFHRLLACWKMLYFVSKQMLLVLNYPWIAPIHLIWKKILNKRPGQPVDKL